MNKSCVYKKNNAYKIFFWAIILQQILAIPFIIFFVKGSIDTVFEIVACSFLAPLTFLCSLYLVHKKDNLKIKNTMPFNFKLNPVFVLISILISLVCIFGFNDLISLFDALVALTGFKGNYSISLVIDSVPMLFWGLFLFAVLPAIFEELVFRGVIFCGLKQKGKIFAIVVSAVLFALMHGQIEQLIYPFIVGLVLGSVMLKTNNILYPILIHFLNNSLVLVISFIADPSGTSTNAPFEFNAKNILLAILLFVISVAVLFVLIKFCFKRKQQKNSATISGDLEKLDNENQHKNNENKSEILQSVQTEILIENVDENNDIISNESDGKKDYSFVFFMFAICLALFLFVVDFMAGFA